MSRIQRWKLSMTSWVDGVLSQIENHEAAVNAAIGDVRQATARARVQLKRVERDQASLRESLAQEESAAARWRTRAVAAADEEAAIECLRRHKSSEQRAALLRTRLLEHERSEHELREGVRVLGARLAELNERKNLMCTRQSRAEAARGMALPAESSADLEDLFDRWEMRVGEIELASERAEPIDAFESRFQQVEERAVLRAELEAMRNEAKEDR